MEVAYALCIVDHEGGREHHADEMDCRILRPPADLQAELVTVIKVDPKTQKEREKQKEKEKQKEEAEQEKEKEEAKSAAEGKSAQDEKNSKPAKPLTPKQQRAEAFKAFASPEASPPEVVPSQLRTFCQMPATTDDEHSPACRLDW